MYLSRRNTKFNVNFGPDKYSIFTVSFVNLECFLVTGIENLVMWSCPFPILVLILSFFILISCSLVPGSHHI